MCWPKLRHRRTHTRRGELPRLQLASPIQMMCGFYGIRTCLCINQAAAQFAFGSANYSSNCSYRKNLQQHQHRLRGTALQCKFRVKSETSGSSRAHTFWLCSAQYMAPNRKRKCSSICDRSQNGRISQNRTMHRPRDQRKSIKPRRRYGKILGQRHL